MKKNFLLLIFSVTLVSLFTFSVSAQTTLFSEDFNSGASTQITMNTTDMGATAAGNHLFYINNSYTGMTANADVPCLGSTFNISISSVTTPDQPAGITGFPHSHYMHINAPCANAVGITNTYFIYSSGTCFGAESYFSKMTNDISTAGMNGVSLSFWWMMGGTAGAIYGEVYYSIDGGVNWTLLSSPIASLVGQQTWTQTTYTNTAFDNQATLRFGWRWYCGNTGATPTDPALAIDDIKIQAPSTISLNTSNPLPDKVCNGNIFSVPYNSTGGSFTGGNVFTAELSDAAGSFAAPTSIGTLTSTASSGTITCTCPMAAAAGTTYKVRVVSSNPAITGIECAGVLSIDQPPTAAFNFSSTGLDVTFTNTSTNAVSYFWNFGDGGTSVQDSPTHTYAAAGTYSICLTATSSYDCTDTFCQNFSYVGLIDVTENNLLSVFPNPASDEIQLMISSSENFDAVLYDVSGKEIFIWKNVNAKSQSVKLNLPEVADGIYQLRISNGKFCSGKRILIQQLQ